jgi:hypothetical protein
LIVLYDELTTNIEGAVMQFPTKHNYAEHSRFALLSPQEYVQHVNRALRDGRGPIAGNYFEDIYKRALREIKKKGARDSVIVDTINRIG